MEYDNTNTFALFKNDKQGNDKAPDYKGKINIDGRDLELAAWIRKSAKGTTYMSGQVSEPWQGNKQDFQAPQKSETFEDDIPFN